jgi:O-antigen/teichoic acid export membrane protein
VKREFLLNILLLVFINLLIKPFFIFGIDLEVQNRTGEAYGLYFTLLSFAYIFQIVSDFGIQIFNNRHVSHHPHLVGKYFPNLLALKVLLSAAYVILSLAAAALSGFRWPALQLLFVLLFNQVLVQAILFLRSYVSGLGHYRLDSFFSSLDKLLMLFTGAWLLWRTPRPAPLSVVDFALSQTAALLITVAVVWWALRVLVRVSVRPSWLGNWRMGRPAVLLLLRQSLPYALAVLLMSAYTRLDGVLVERLLPDGPAHAEVYAGAYRLLDAANMLGFLFASLLLPMFARLLGRGEPVRPLVSLSFKLIWAGSVTLAAAVCFGRRELIELMMPERASAYRWDTLGVLIWTFVPVSSTYIFATLLTAGQRLRQMNRFFIAAIVLDVALNLALVPRFQALGSAVVTLSTQTFIALCMIGLAARHFDLRSGTAGVARIAGFGLLVVAADWLIFEWAALPWPWDFAAALGAGPVFMVLLGMVDLRKLKGVLKKEDAGSRLRRGAD